MKSNTYTAVYKKVRGGYTAWVEEMPGVISEGKTRAQAQRNLKDALALMLETNRIMSHKDAVGDIERSPISVPVPAGTARSWFCTSCEAGAFSCVKGQNIPSTAT